MNKSIFFLLAISMFIISCNNPQTGSNDSIIDSLTSEQINETEQAVVYITENGIVNIDNEDVFTLDMYQNDDLPASFNEWSFMSENLTVMEEGVAYDNKQLSMVKNGEDIAVDDSYGIHIYNSTIKTKAGISCGSTIEELCEAYQQYELFYSYVSEQVRFYSLQNENIVFIFSIDDIDTDKDLMDSDYISLTKDDIIKNAKVIEIAVLR